ncbi:MAG: sensor histidine kinase [[Ruminococcus] torques]|uniref:HAMP domain-containing sensor histidine kinase n=1 Tax=[Ruminococcus] torques TaxID=33039 RepID=UPI00241EA185|nr:HAMP domain-containing sensor histidine kinase [[Ruminococcus] torques]MBD9269175.1 sensor histidine kinase [[Ruminococcus] torques]
MRSTLHIKFIALYIIFGFLCLFSTATLTEQLVTDKLTEDTSHTLYREATFVANDYLPSYFSGDSSIYNVQSQLSAMRLYFNASIWFVDSTGRTLTSSSLEDTVCPDRIKDFNPAEIGGNRYITGTYHGYFDEDMITVMAPVTQGFSTKGYLLIHSPVSAIEERCAPIMTQVYISTAVIFALSLIFLLGVQFFIHRPLRQISEAAKQYAIGNLDYEIPVHTHDELGYLSASLNYMAVRLKDMDDYQKKIVANVSHDFRSPLTSIKGYVNAILDGTIPYEMQERYLKIIAFESERLEKLTRSLLTLNELDMKKRMMHIQRFDINDTIKNTAATFEGICTSRQIRLELLLSGHELYVRADMEQIQQVLYNLLDNAIKFSNDNSSVQIETTVKSGKVFVSVKDYGTGIPKESLSKIWDRFYKIDASRGKDRKGTGLGLSIVKEIINAHNQNIDVISTEGVGTEFIFTLEKTK